MMKTLIDILEVILMPLALFVAAHIIILWIILPTLIILL